MQPLTAHGSEFAKLEYSADSGAIWNDIPGINGYTESGGEAPERDIVAFSGVAKRSGHTRVPSVEVSAIYQPAHAAWRALRQASIDGTLLVFRLTTLEEDQFVASGNANTVAIDTSGVVTFTGVQPPWNEGLIGPGQVIKVGTDAYVIDSLSNDSPPEVKVKPAPDSAVDDTSDYSIVLPSLRRRFSATVRLADRVSLESEGDMNTTLTLAPRATLPEWSIV